jgi:hypothetical protein
MNGSGLTTPSLGVQNVWTAGFGFRASQINAEWRLLDAGVEQCRLELHDNGDSTYEWKLMRGVTEIDRTAEAFALNIWHYFEFQVTVRTGINGAYELRHNEVNVMSGSAVNLAEGGSDGADAHGFGYNSGGQVVKFDDIYILDNQGTVNNNFLGDSVIVGLLPDGEGNQNDFTPSTGIDNSALVDDASASPSETDYVSSDTNTHQDWYTYGDLPATGLGAIRAVSVISDAAMETVGNRTLKPKFRAVSTTEGDGANFVVQGTSVLSHPVIMEVDPVTTTTWTQSEIDGGEFGIEVVS